MADDLDDLQQLAPAVDTDRARDAFRRRRRRSRSLRRGALALAAVTVLVAGTVGVATNLDDDAPLIAGPGEAVPTGPVTFDVLTVARASDELGTLRSAVDEGEYVNLWKYANASDPLPEIDFDEQVVVSITIPGTGCEPALTELGRDGDTITPVFVVTEDVCTRNLVARTYVVAIDRSTVGSTFTLRLPADPVYGIDEQRLIVVLDSSAPSGGSPIVWVQEPSLTNEGLGAMVGGRVRYDSDNGCFQVQGGGEVWYPVIWPAGTVGTADGPGVVLPDGQVARVGDEVLGGGGYFDTADEYGIPAACLPDTGEVAAFNPNGAVEVNRAPALPGPEPTCTEIQAFAASLPNMRPVSDYTSSESPERLLAEADLVVYGELAGVVEVDGPDVPVPHRATYEIEVSQRFKEPDGIARDRVLSVVVPSPVPVSDEEAVALREAAVPGIPVIVFAFSSDLYPGFTVGIEGFMTACPGDPPIGFVSPRPGWANVETLDDLLSRLEAAAR